MGGRGCSRRKEDFLRLLTKGHQRFVALLHHIPVQGFLPRVQHHPWLHDGERHRQSGERGVSPSVPRSGLLKMPCGEEKSLEIKEIPRVVLLAWVLMLFLGVPRETLGFFPPELQHTDNPSVQDQTLCGAVWGWGAGGSLVPPPSFRQTISRSNLCPAPSSIPVCPVLILLGISPPRVLHIAGAGMCVPSPQGPELCLHPP